VIELYRDPRHVVYRGDSVTDGLPCEVDTLICDAPYSERTHKSNASTMFSDVTGGPRSTKVPRPIAFACWTPATVAFAVAAWAPRVRGWFVTITDHILAPAWAEALESVGLYVFAPLPFLSPGSRIRLAGDGPSTWVCWIVVARPRREPYSKWGTLPGGYVVGPERNVELVGGKPLRLMTALVGDYSRPGDLVADPCAGSGTLGRACEDTGRRSLQIDIKEEHARMAIRRLKQQALPGLEV
jgi:hypothetical protein